MANKCNEGDIDAICYGYMASKALFAALDLSVFDAIDNLCVSNRKCDITTLSKSLNINESRLEILINSLLSLKLIKYDNNNNLINTKNVSKFMVKKSKHFYGDYLRYQIDRQMYPRMKSLSNTIQTGIAQTYSDWFKHANEAVLYTESQQNGSKGVGNMIYKSTDFKSLNIKHILDLGGGSGAVSIELLKKDSKLTSTVLDFENVCKTGKTLLKQPKYDNIRNRLNFVGCNVLQFDYDLFEDMGYDCILLSYLLISIPSVEIEKLLRKCFKLLNDRNGYIVIHDFIVNDDDMDNDKNFKFASLWSLQHLTVNPGAMMLTKKRLSGVLEDCGFTDVKFINAIPRITRIVIARRNSKKFNRIAKL
eukprot:330561_1